MEEEMEEVEGDRIMTNREGGGCYRGISGSWKRRTQY